MGTILSKSNIDVQAVSSNRAVDVDRRGILLILLATPSVSYGGNPVLNQVASLHV